MSVASQEMPVLRSQQRALSVSQLWWRLFSKICEVVGMGNGIRKLKTNATAWPTKRFVTAHQFEGVPYWGAFQAVTDQSRCQKPKYYDRTFLSTWDIGCAWKASVSNQIWRKTKNICKAIWGVHLKVAHGTEHTCFRSAGGHLNEAVASRKKIPEGGAPR